MVKHLPTMRETQVQSLGREDLLEKEMAIHSRILSWKVSWLRSLVGYSPWGGKELDTTERFHFHFHFDEQTGVHQVLGVHQGLGLREVLHGWSWVCRQEVEPDKAGKEDRKQLGTT